MNGPNIYNVSDQIEYSTRLTLYIKTDGGETGGGSTGGPAIDSTSKVGYYADLEGDGTVDGVIYADLAVGGSGQWGTGFFTSYGNYTIPKVSSGLKDYYVSQTNYAGAFGTKDVISPNGSGTDRFYVMALNDIDSNTHYWYYSARNLDNPINYSINDFGEGKTNTTTMISKWNSSAYGTQNSNDMWGLIQTQANNEWFVPSKSELAAFGGELGITTSNYTGYGLNDLYWSSTQNDTSLVYFAAFNNGYMYNLSADSNFSVRLSTTF